MGFRVAEDGRPPLPKSGSRPRYVRMYRRSTDTGRVRGNGHSSTFYPAFTNSFRPAVSDTSTVSTVDHVGQ